MGSAAVCDPNPPRPFARYRIFKFSNYFLADVADTFYSGNREGGGGFPRTGGGVVRTGAWGVSREEGGGEFFFCFGAEMSVKT